MTEKGKSGRITETVTRIVAGLCGILSIIAIPAGSDAWWKLLPAGAAFAAYGWLHRSGA